jgi:hypothetical protein
VWGVRRNEEHRDALARGDLADVEEWNRALPMDAVVRRIDPIASNPLVQTNAVVGFRTGVVRITGDEYESALALSRGDRRPS